MIDFINKPMDTMVGDNPPNVPPERDELADLVRCVVRAADGRKAENIIAMRVSKVSTITSWVVVVCGNSRPQNQAIAAAVKEDVLEQYDLLPGSAGVPEGDAQSGWIVLDYGSVMVHVMTPKSRLYYNIERQWKEKGGEYMDISDIIIPNTVDSHFGSTPAPAFGAPAPAGGLFGSPAPAPSGGLFGSTPAPAPTSSFFGSAPAPSGGLFGSAPAPSGGLFGSAPAPSGGLFGSAPAPSSGGLFGSAPAPSGGLFGSTPASSGGLFGSAPAPSGGLFGTSSSSLFGAPSSSVPVQQQIPAQAALQAHMDASARQEAERVRAALERLNAAYAGHPNGEGESKFVAIVYNPISPEQRQLQWFHGMGNGGLIPAPERPPHVSEKQWTKAVVENPDPQNYVPNALVGAAALQARINWQQDRARELASHAATLQRSQDTIRDRSLQAQQDVEQKARKHAALRTRLLDVMRRVELARCMNQPTQPDELRVLQRLSALHKQVDTVRTGLLALQDKSRTQSSTAARSMIMTEVPEAAQVLPVLKDHRKKLETLANVAQKDQRDVGLIHKRVSSVRTLRM